MIPNDALDLCIYVRCHYCPRLASTVSLAVEDFARWARAIRHRSRNACVYGASSGFD